MIPSTPRCKSPRNRLCLRGWETSWVIPRPDRTIQYRHRRDKDRAQTGDSDFGVLSHHEGRLTSGRCDGAPIHEGNTKTCAWELNPTLSNGDGREKHHAWRATGLDDLRGPGAYRRVCARKDPVGGSPACLQPANCLFPMLHLRSHATAALLR